MRNKYKIVLGVIISLILIVSVSLNAYLLFLKNSYKSFLTKYFGCNFNTLICEKKPNENYKYFPMGTNVETEDYRFYELDSDGKLLLTEQGIMFDSMPIVIKILNTGIN